MADERLTNLRNEILQAVSETPGGVTIAQLEDRLRGKIEFWQGEIQEVLWRLAAAKRLKITATGKIMKEELVGHGEP